VKRVTENFESNASPKPAPGHDQILMPRRDLTGCRVLITGASSGIGRELALALGSESARLILVARRRDRLEALQQELQAADRDVAFVTGDIVDPAVRKATLQAAEELGGGLDILINNAGIGALGAFAEADEARLRRVMEVNFFAGVELIRAALPVLKRGHGPAIVNIGSILGKRGIPLHTEYCASKFALQGFSEALRAELRPAGIDVLQVNPGTTDTEFFDSLIDKQGAVPWAVRKGVPASQVAQATLRALRNRRHEIIPSARGRMLCWLQRAAPWLVDRIMGRYGDRLSEQA